MQRDYVPRMINLERSDYQIVKRMAEERGLGDKGFSWVERDPHLRTSCKGKGTPFIVWKSLYILLSHLRDSDYLAKVLWERPMHNCE